MQTERLEIGGTLVFESTKYETTEFNDACFEFTERASDYWCSDSVNSVTIDEEMAHKIIDALSKHFGFSKEKP